jgi:hypothetical protein
VGGSGGEYIYANVVNKSLLLTECCKMTSTSFFTLSNSCISNAVNGSVLLLLRSLNLRLRIALNAFFALVVLSFSIVAVGWL